MFLNYLKIAVRNILKHKGYSAINIVGLSLGLTCSILIMLWVRDEHHGDRRVRGFGAHDVVELASQLAQGHGPVELPGEQRHSAGEA